MKNNSVGISNAKIIFLGEHSAVYGKPAIVFPTPQIKVTTNIKTAKQNKIISDIYTGTFNQMPASMAGLFALINRLNKNLNKNKQPLEINIKSEIPVGRGMGSSAASASSLIRAFYNLFEIPLSFNGLKEFTDIEEKITHGNPSGVDSETVNRNVPILFEQQKFSPFSFAGNGQIVIADTGEAGDTKTAVSMVKKAMENHPQTINSAIDNLGDLAERAKMSLKNDELKETGILMNKAQHNLSQLGVSTPKIDNLINVANANGALGAKLTGSGLGGCIIALTSDSIASSQVQTALKSNGAENVWIQSLNEMV